MGFIFFRVVKGRFEGMKKRGENILIASNAKTSSYLDT